MAHAKNHDYHILAPSTWPLLAAVAGFAWIGALLFCGATFARSGRSAAFSLRVKPGQLLRGRCGLCGCRTAVFGFACWEAWEAALGGLQTARSSDT